MTIFYISLSNDLFELKINDLSVSSSGAHKVIFEILNKTHTIKIKTVSKTH